MFGSFSLQKSGHGLELALQHLQPRVHPHAHPLQLPVFLLQLSILGLQLLQLPAHLFPGLLRFLGGGLVFKKNPENPANRGLIFKNAKVEVGIRKNKGFFKIKTGLILNGHRFKSVGVDFQKK